MSAMHFHVEPFGLNILPFQEMYKLHNFTDSDNKSEAT